MQEKEIQLKRDFHSIQYKFDQVLKQSTTQFQLFENLESLITAYTLGINTTVFAYGQTGAGKTHSIVGNFDNGKRQVSALNYGQDWGIIPRALQRIYKLISTSQVS